MWKFNFRGFHGNFCSFAVKQTNSLCVLFSAVVGCCFVQSGKWVKFGAEYQGHRVIVVSCFYGIE